MNGDLKLMAVGRELGALVQLHFQRFGEVTRGILVIAGRVLSGDQLELELPFFLPQARYQGFLGGITPKEREKPVLAGIVVERGFFYPAKERARFREG